jgi:ABC-type multidrug transport system ATPase subunit
VRVIVARDLCLTLEGRAILDHVSLDVARGEAVALVGPNGSGKTSVLRCLLGLVPFTGSASIGGRDVVREPVAARLQVGYVPQKAAFGDARAAEALAFAARLRGLDPQQSRGLLRLVGLEAHAGERVRTFSGGMQQRLALAVALLGEPPVLLLDEPSASLDADGQRTFFEVVDRLRSQGRTVVLASHRAEEVDNLTDRVVRLDAGRVTAADAAERPGRVVRVAVRRGGVARA